MVTKIPIALIVDDGAPVNLIHYTHPGRASEFLVPNSFTQEFADLCTAYGVKGKFSVLPMPCELGRIDERLNYVPAAHLRRFLEIAREGIAPRFDITPEILTHRCACDLKSGGSLHVFEDVWFKDAGVAAMTDYIALALRILKNAGLPANGVTSPWSTGIEQEALYARAIAEAQWRVHRRKVTWYFLHCLGPATARWPWVTCEGPRPGQAVVSVPANTTDAFWPTQGCRNRRASSAAANRAADAWLTRDGTQGQVRELFDAGKPILLLTHWQSLFSDGYAAGLERLGNVFERIRRTLGTQVEWVTCSELARRALAPDKPPLH